MTTTIGILRQPSVFIGVMMNAPTNIPWVSWAWFMFAAVVGSLIYGASLQMATGAFDEPLFSALRLTVASGAGWIVLGPALIMFGKLHPLVAAHACLVAMTYGEGVLLLTALVNLSALLIDSPRAFAVLNATAILCSNLLMVTVLACQLRVAEMPVWITVTLWCVVLNGIGAFVFLTFPHLVPSI